MHFCPIYDLQPCKFVTFYFIIFRSDQPYVTTSVNTHVQQASEAMGIVQLFIQYFL